MGGELGWKGGERGVVGRLVYVESEDCVGGFAAIGVKGKVDELFLGAKF